MGMSPMPGIFAEGRRGAVVHQAGDDEALAFAQLDVSSRRGAWPARGMVKPAKLTPLARSMVETSGLT